MDRPYAEIDMSDLKNDKITFKNLDLKGCYEGDLYGDFMLYRGYLHDDGTWTHMRKEYQKDVMIGSIGCNPSCMKCWGQGQHDCYLCADLDLYNYEGQCYDECPEFAPYWTTYEQVHAQARHNGKRCLTKCSLGQYPDTVTNQCLKCNNDCQTCENNYIASCKTCNPIKFLYNGICVGDCPGPHQMNNYTDYTCVETS